MPRGGSEKGSRPNNGGARPKVRDDDERGRPSTYWRGTIGTDARRALDTLAAGAHEGQTIARVLIAMERWQAPLDQIAADLGFPDGQALLDALIARYDAQPGLVLLGLRDALFPVHERRVMQAAVEEMLAERDAPDPKDFIL